MCRRIVELACSFVGGSEGAGRTQPAEFAEPGAVWSSTLYDLRKWDSSCMSNDRFEDPFCPTPKFRPPACDAQRLTAMPPKSTTPITVRQAGFVRLASGMAWRPLTTDH